MTLLDEVLNFLSSKGGWKKKKIVCYTKDDDGRLRACTSISEGTEYVTKMDYDNALINENTYVLTVSIKVVSDELNNTIGYALTRNGTKFFKDNGYGLMDTIEEAISALHDYKQKKGLK